MKRTVTALCFAAAFGFATLGAQTTTTTPNQRSAMNDKAAHEVTITGCLAKDPSGSGFMLTNAHVDTNMASSTTGAGATTTAGTTGATTTNPSGSSMSNAPATTWTLMGGNDLDRHVGHKIQVTGKTSWDGASHSPSSTASAAGAGTTAVTANPDPTTTTAGAAGTTGTTGTLEEEQRTKNRDRGKTMEHPHLDVQSVKMISTSCS